MHEDNEFFIGVLTHLASKSPTMISELRKFYILLDTYEIKIRTLYIKSDANIWANNISRITDNSDWQLAPRIFVTSTICGGALGGPIRLPRQQTTFKLQRQVERRHTKGYGLHPPTQHG